MFKRYTAILLTLVISLAANVAVGAGALKKSSIKKRSTRSKKKD